MSLHVCASCARHARGVDCPYCGAALVSSPADAGALAGLSRMGRAALALGGVTAFSAAMVACYGAPIPPRPPADAHDPDAPATQVDAGTDGTTGP